MYQSCTKLTRFSKAILKIQHCLYVLLNLETPAAVSLAVVWRKIELGDLCEPQSWHYLQAQTLASWTDRTKNRPQWTHVAGCRYLSSLIQDIVVVITIRFALCFLASHMPLESL